MYEQITSWDNLYLAWRKAAKGKRGKPNVAQFEYALEENLLALQAELREQRYRPGNYVSFVIHEPKRRVISAAPFRDRIAHHALCNVIEPIFERSFIDDSYANRVGKGTHRALDRCQQFMRRYPYVLACDIRQFFPAVDHAILYEILCRKVNDAAVQRLIRLILASGEGVLREAYTQVWFAGDDLLAALRPKGLPIGNLTSQFWANCYLNPFDHFVKRELCCHAYVRYVDDLALWSDSKDQLWEWKAALETRLARLRLTIHPGACPRPVTDGIGFLGFHVFPERRRLKNRKAVRYGQKLQQMLADYADGALSLDAMTASVQGWVNHVRFGNTVGLRKSLLTAQTIPRKQRKIA
ncbi:MAG: reverse transcriptase/maturase family protein [Anaerolineae bacterium]|nr:reverse transcriptase/maturase family protein [Anaerolineae bacterium]